jgi:anti-anti-sigma regulatory factor
MARCYGAYDDGVLRVACAGSPAVVRIAGEIDESSYSGLVGALERLADREGDVHINLAALTFCDLAGLRAILRLAGTGRGPNGPSGKRLILHDVPGHLTRVLQILGWDSTPAWSQTSQPTSPRALPE